MTIKDLIIRLCPQKILYFRKKIVYLYLIKCSRKNHTHELIKLRNKKIINVCFFAVSAQAWKCDGLYRLMEKDPRFNPVILICPITNYGAENMIQRMKEAHAAFSKLEYNVVLSYNSKERTYIDVRKEINPDIIIYTNPYKGLIDKRYYINRFMDKLTIYIPYFFTESKDYQNGYNLLLHNLVWKFYVETLDCFIYAQRASKLNKNNLVFSGYPGIDPYISSKRLQCDPWKIQNRNIKRIIWAPHHTIDHYNPVCDYSTFLLYYDFMIRIAKKYKNEIQIAFKPHPILKNRLYIKWGKEKTDNYYNEWNKLPNGFLCDSLYQDLFLTSDAIMHDCGSFISEYLFTGKPALHLHNGISYEKQYNDTAIESLSHYYQARTEKEIEHFIIDVVKEKDLKRNDRIKYVREKLMPPNYLTASENIFNDIVSEIFSKKSITVESSNRLLADPQNR